MRSSTIIVGVLLLFFAAAAVAGEPDDDVIRLVPQGTQTEETGPGTMDMSEPRRGFDYSSFVARLESLWFQRKTLMASGRDQDARAQLEQIRAFCTEEGVERLEHLAGALVSEAHRYHEEGNDEHALMALEFAEGFDPNRPQVHVARATVLWHSGGGVVAAARELIRAVGAAVMRSVQDLSLLPRLVFLIGLAWIAAALTFAVVMLLRYQAALRHEIEEFVLDYTKAPWPEVAGWFVLALPLMVWAGAGWAALFWMVMVFRFMARSEKIATAGLLLGGTLIVPVYGLAVGVYGTSADPSVRTTVRSVEGDYDPDRIIRLRQLVEAHPNDPAYHFLLGGLYKNGRYFEEAFDEYKAVLDLDPSFEAAHINIGNIFYSTRQYAAAITAYRQATELNGSSFLAYFNLHLAQSEDFHFTEAEESLRRARELDADRVAQLLVSDVDERASVQDASLRLFSVLEAAVGGRSPMATRQAGSGIALLPQGGLINPVAILCALTLIGCLTVAGISRSAPARRCIRCGRPFCHRCKSSHEAQEYCSQCLHLYVLRDGLEPETKARKLYEVRVHESRTRRLRGFLALLFPGSGQLFRGKTARGLLLLVVWFILLIAAAPELLSFGADSGLRLSGDLLLPSQIPMRFEGHPGRFFAALMLPLAWFVANWPLRPSKEA